MNAALEQACSEAYHTHRCYKRLCCALCAQQCSSVMALAFVNPTAPRPGFMRKATVCAPGAAVAQMYIRSVPGQRTAGRLAPFRPPSGISTATQAMRVASDVVDVMPKLSAASTPATFLWKRFWYPAAPVSNLDTSRPTRLTLLGQDLVVWYSKATDTWSVFRDQCPHRLAPLSEGRLVGNNLVCSYHGWAFTTSGHCASIPQAPPDQQATVCADKHTCASSYPTTVYGGMLYVWMDNSPEGLELSKAHGLTAIQNGQAQSVAMRFPVDARMWLEQGWDPTHANYLHHGNGFSMQDTLPMRTHNVSKVDLTKGFSLEHGGYEKKNSDMKATRIFVPPCHNITIYRTATVNAVVLFSTVPATPDSCHSVGMMQFLPPGQEPTLLVNGVPLQVPPPTEPPGCTPTTHNKASGQSGQKSASWMFRMIKLLSTVTLPHWVAPIYRVSDQDLVVMARQGSAMSLANQSYKAYHVAVKDADIGVVMVNRWLKMAGYPEAVFPGLDQSTFQAKDLLTLDQLLDRRKMHVDTCVTCQKGLQLVTKICWTVTVAAGLLAAFSTALAAQAIWSTLVEGAKLSPDVLAPVAGSLLFAGLLAAAASKLWDYREFTFISGARAWRKKGGLSLVPRV